MNMRPDMPKGAGINGPVVSPTTTQIFSALAKAHALIENVAQNREVEVPIKDKNNPGQYKGKYKFLYATMAGILHHIRQPLTANGIWYTQYIRRGEMVTLIYHKSGEWMETGNIPLPDIKGSPQDIGSIVSYFKRYSLSEAMGLGTEEDNDGEQGDREVSFRAMGNAGRQQKDDGDPEDVGVRPPEGMSWGDWARRLIETVAGKETDRELDELKETNKTLINGVARYDRNMYADIQKAFVNRRAVVNDEIPF